MSFWQANIKKRFYAVTPIFFQHFSWLPLRLFMMIFCSLKIIGRERAEAYRGNVIFAMNHSSELDPVFLVSTLPFFSRHLPLYFVAREKSFYRTSKLRPFYGGRFFQMMGAYPAYPGSKNYDMALRHHIQAAQQGHNICIFPMGTRHAPTDTAKARGGVAYLAHKTGLPIVPVYFAGFNRYTLGDYLRRKCRLTITFGEPIPASSLLGYHDQVQPHNPKPYEKAAVDLMERIVHLT